MEELHLPQLVGAQLEAEQPLLGRGEGTERVSINAALTAGS